MQHIFFTFEMNMYIEQKLVIGFSKCKVSSFRVK
uniref:Uncharacterized protein n=1 Tax=Anguilla anguilla TaxID=7936 RepID=A0A0E9SZD1_ANGAN